MTEANKTRDESFDPISDTEEETEDIVEALDHDEDDDDDDDINPPLPNTQQRVSCRK
ncbi:hypothetical protein N7505_007569, partial [Penicillium chrysogenum]